MTIDTKAFDDFDAAMLSAETAQVTLAPPLSAALSTPGEPLVAPAAARQGPSRLSVATWSVLGLAAAGYMAVAATNPSALPDLSHTAMRSAQLAETATAPAAPGEAQSQRDTVARLQAEVARLTANIIASEERAAALSQKLAALEGPATSRSAAAQTPAASGNGSPASEAAAIAGKFADAPPAVPAPAAGKSAPAKVADAKTSDTKAPDAKAGASGSANKAAAAAQGVAQGLERKEIAAAETAAHSDVPTPTTTTAVKVINSNSPPPAAPAAQIETGSIAAPAPAPAPQQPISFGQAVVKPAAPRQIGLQIASGGSVDDLRQTWNELSILHSDSLKSLQPRYVGKSANGDPAAADRFDLVAGPFRSATQAARTCRTLQLRGVACHVADFEGNAM